MLFNLRPCRMLLLAVACAGDAVHADPCADSSPASRTLLAADRSLAQAAQSETGAAAAFLKVLSPDSELFVPRLASAQWFWQRAEAADSAPGWSPLTVASSADGQLGYTLGPYWNQRDPARRVRGHYLAIWLHDEATGWQLQLDHGVAVETPELAPRTADESCPQAPAPVSDLERLQRFEALRQTEVELPASRVRWQLQSPGALARCALPVARMRMAASADLAYTAGAERGRSFVRIWRFPSSGTRWQLEVELCSAATDADTED